MSRVNTAKVVTAKFCSREVTLRRATGAWVGGRWTTGAPTDTTIRGSFQKVTARELQQIGLGDIATEVRKFLTPTEIKEAQGDSQASDRIVNAGRRYKVLKVDDNSEFGYWRAYVTFEGAE